MVGQQRQHQHPQVGAGAEMDPAAPCSSTTCERIVFEAGANSALSSSSATALTVPAGSRSEGFTEQCEEDLAARRRRRRRRRSKHHGTIPSSCFLRPTSASLLAFFLLATALLLSLLASPASAMAFPSRGEVESRLGRLEERLAWAEAEADLMREAAEEEEEEEGAPQSYLNFLGPSERSVEEEEEDGLEAARPRLQQRRPRRPRRKARRSTRRSSRTTRTNHCAADASGLKTRVCQNCAKITRTRNAYSTCCHNVNNAYGWCKRIYDFTNPLG